MLDPLGTSIQQKDEETLLNIVQPSYMGLGLELRDLPTCPKLQQLFRSQRNPQLIFMRDSVRPAEYTLLSTWKRQKMSKWSMSLL
jgi:hypothetical protein